MWNGKTVSVALPTYNEKESIRACIEGFFDTGVVDEVVVCNNSSSPWKNEALHLKVFLILAFSSLVIPQIVTRAHINHTYAGLVLLIPLAIANRRIMLSWIGMVAIHLYSHLAAFQLGRSVVLPQMFSDYAPAQRFLFQLNDALVRQPYKSLLQLQDSANQFLVPYLPGEPVVTLLSLVQFVFVVLIMREMSKRLESRVKLALILPDRLAAYLRVLTQ